MKILDAIHDEDLKDGVFRIPKDIDKIDKIAINAFNSCTLLESIEVEEGNEKYSSVDGVLFDKDKNILDRFPRMHKATSYHIPEGVEKISFSAFSWCENLKEISFPNSVKEIGAFAFISCKNLEEVTIPDSVKGIGFLAFECCENLKQVMISNNVTWLCFKTFSGCINLERIYIPNSVTEFDDRIFEKCNKLTIYCHKGSGAEKYAKENNIPVAYVEENE